ncbi:DUF4440 domain-containing protein [Rubrivirga sp. S365]|uniref:DUF4440 domain-containing protein n=1 Tax=Rubrivirga litoralis TaxID=3075598 RepID=A0ABU3BRX5_9BACT|nr:MULTISPECIES: DUF4440 domain-containing protein [unclassified Rubrivirga]MDT0632000.1 DUF4440 domain-containing protein [Rubrivirga sp. F394]MDT7855307.1 DUF4440 domain-containing protein [Rubrivirga sp. S365]
MTEVVPFFERYAEAFVAYDAGAIAACYLTPSLLVRDGQAEVLGTAEAVAESVEALLALHRAWDVQKVQPDGVEVLEDGPAHAVVRVDWQLGRPRTRLRWLFATTYTLVPAADGGDGWRIAVAVTHDAPF